MLTINSSFICFTLRTEIGMATKMKGDSYLPLISGSGLDGFLTSMGLCFLFKLQSILDCGSNVDAYVDDNA